MKFLVDNQLPLQLSRFLRERGHDSEHLLDIGLDNADDATVWFRAAADERILISKDEDFVILANRPNDAGRLVWVRLGNCRNSALIAAFDGALSAIEGCFDAGQRIVELR